MGRGPAGAHILPRFSALKGEDLKIIAEWMW
jgi:hypothetical protein